ncbi:MAG TPA: GvpL/GvpF family gas vesicle protein [Methanotrichaceae archaeon]|nr:GvpL/GvpF family gas vesicle protein [Methanotrichaceae archaeon]
MSETAGEGRYIYSVVKADIESNLGDVGIENSNVYLVPNRDIAAVVHSCVAEPYTTHDDEKAKEWVLEHSYVIDCATNRFGTVLPISFDVIVAGDDDVVKDWLEDNYDFLKDELERVKDKAEYSVLIFCDEGQMADRIVSGNPELLKLKENIETMPKGTAYLYRRKFELKTKKELSEQVFKLAKDFSAEIRELVDSIKIEKKVSLVPEKYRGKMLVAALTCLVHHDRVEVLGNLLEEIDKREGLSVRFTGPWAPFSFVQLKDT